MIGAKVELVRAQGCIKIDEPGKEYTIKEVKFRVSLDGKILTIIRLEELPDAIFTWKDLRWVG